jgi:hypothetical protein
MKQELDRYKDGKAGIEEMIKPLRIYNTEVNAVYNERIANERAALDKISGMYSEFTKLTLTGNVKEVKQHGIEILKEVKGQAAQIIAVESDRYKTLIAGEQAYATKVYELIKAKETEIKGLETRLKDMNKTFEEQRRTVSGDYNNGYDYLNPNLDAYQKRQAVVDKLRRDEAEALNETDSSRRDAMLQKVSTGWAGISDAVVVTRQEMKRFYQDNPNGGKDIVERLVTVQDELLTKADALNESQSEQKRIQLEIIGLAKDEKTAWDNIYKSATGSIDQQKQKVVELDDLLKNLTRDITINLKVNGLEQIDKITGIVGSAVRSPYASATPPVTANTSGNGFQVGGNPWDYTQVGDSFYWGDGTYGGPAFERGTERVPQTGLALVHQNEKIVPASHNSNSTANTTFSGPININLPDVTNVRDFARQLLPHLQLLQSRFINARIA